jgi:FkbM family methyltransferase
MRRSLVSDALVSIIIPTYNRAAMVVDAVESALAQTHREVEIIVVDDGSTDDTQERLERFGDRIVRLHQTNQGVSAARNAALRRATGEFIAFLDSDDLWHHRKLEIQLAYLRENPELGLLASHIGRIGAGQERCREPLPDLSRIPCDTVTLAESVLAPRFATSTVIVRRSAVAARDWFDTRLPTAEDRDLWIRIVARSPVRRLDVELAFGRANQSDHLSARPSCTDGNALRMLDKVFREVPELRGRSALRRRARSAALYQSGLLYTECSLHLRALKRVIQSLITWPLPSRMEIDPRIKSILVMGLRLVGLRSSSAQQTPIPVNRQRSSIYWQRLASNLVLAYLRHSPIERGKWRLMRLANTFLVVRLDSGELVRVTGLSHVERKLMLDGAFEPETLQLFAELLQPGFTVFDLGANLGVYSLVAGRQVGNTGFVHAFEPASEMAAVLRRNIALNCLQNVVVNVAAVAESVGTRRLSLTEDVGGNTIMMATQECDWADVTTTTIDDYVLRHDLRSVDVIKMDIEGAECLALRGGRRLLSSADAPIVILEINPAALRAGGSSAEELSKLLDEFGYTLHVIATYGRETHDPWTNVIAAKAMHLARIPALVRWLRSNGDFDSSRLLTRPAKTNSLRALVLSAGSCPPSS